MEEAKSGYGNPWDDMNWLPAVTAWVAERLRLGGRELNGPPQVVKSWSISCLVRFPTRDGAVYYKAVPALFAREPAVLRTLWERYPGSIPELIAEREEGEGARGFLMHGFTGTPLQRAPDTEALTVAEDVEPWKAAACLLARMQIDLAGKEDELRAWGVAERPLADLAESLPALLADELPAVARHGYEMEAEALAQLAALAPRLAAAGDILLGGPIPTASLVHGDFHGGNVVLVGDRPLIYDWTDAALTHPFFDLPILFESNRGPQGEARLQVRDAYLQVWADAGYGALPALRAAYDLAEAVAPLYHAVSYAGIYAATGEQGRKELGSALPWLFRLLLRTADRLPPV